MAACLPLTHSSCSIDHFSPLFSKMSMISAQQLFFISFPMSTPLGSIGCQGTALGSFVVSGGGRVGCETVSYLEFPVWVLGRLLGIPILITNFLFQLRSLPDKLEPSSRCVTNCCLPFCSFAAPCNNRLWTCRAVQKLHLDFLVKNLFVPGFLLRLLLLRNVCVH